MSNKKIGTRLGGQLGDLIGCYVVEYLSGFIFGRSSNVKRPKQVNANAKENISNSNNSTAANEANSQTIKNKTTVAKEGENQKLKK